MQYQLTKKMVGLAIALIFTSMGLLLTGASQADPLQTSCAPHEDSIVFYYETAAQIEPVGGLYLPGHDATEPEFAWGVTSPYKREICGANLRRGSRLATR